MTWPGYYAVGWMSRWKLTVVALAIGFCANAEDPKRPAAATLSQSIADRVDLSSVHDLLAKRCYECHSAAKQKGGLRLDTREAALEGGDSGPSILPGRGGDSRLIQLVAGVDADEVMPPKGPKLSDAEVLVLRRWIDQGADWPTNATEGSARSTHWSFQPPIRHVPSQVKNGRWVKTPIDQFILARLETEGVQPSPEASRETLVRR